jgi:hypothetical protein
MAKIVFGGGVSLASGKVGGTVYSRNKGGAYSRNWVVPTNPQTSKQEDQRNLLAQKSAAWRTLTDSQRTSWESWANDNPILDRVGNSIVLTGAQAYNKININRSNAGDSATQSTTPSTATFTANVIDTSTAVHIDISSGQVFVPLGSGAAASQIVFAHASRPVSAGVTNTNSDLRLIIVQTISAGNVSNGYFNMFTAYESYWGSLTGKTGFRINVSAQEYDEGQFSVPAKVTGIVAA